MKVLVVNCGSSSVKYQLFDMTTEKSLARGLVERIGEGEAQHSHRTDRREWKRAVAAENHVQAMHLVAEALLHPEWGVIGDASEVAAVGHRVVHGGEEFTASVTITPEVEETIERLAPLAPLHNPPNLAGIRAAKDTFPDVPHVAVFDTTFHRSMPDYAYIYGIPYRFYAGQHIRRYGFHGTSFRFVAQRTAQLMGVPKERLDAILCHLGNGCSMAAVKQGRSVDTTMGLTPLEGLLMGTRSGDIDPGVLFHLMRTDGMSPAQVEKMLNKESGLLGISGISNDQRPLEEAMETNPRARLAMQVFAYRVKKYVGAYYAVLNGADALVFTGGIGEKGVLSRRDICSGMEALGIRLDEAANAACRGEGRISAPDSKVQIWVVPTNEELMIARDTAAIAGGGRVE